MNNTGAHAPLWAADHPYYGPEAGGDYAIAFDSWSDFAEHWGRSDEDLNLVFRWDWVDGTGDGDGEEFNGIPAGAAELTLFAVMPRKSTLVNVTIHLTRDDEPRARTWLLDRLRHLMRLWSPLAPDMPPGISPTDIAERAMLFFADAAGKAPLR